MTNNYKVSGCKLTKSSKNLDHRAMSRDEMHDYYKAHVQSLQKINPQRPSKRREKKALMKVDAGEPMMGSFERGFERKFVTYWVETRKA